MHAFTLIEMILAIGIAAIVLIAVNAVLFTALRLREATADMVDAASPVDQTVTFLRRDLQCVVTPTNGTTQSFVRRFPGWQRDQPRRQPNRWRLKCSPRPAR